MELSDRKFFGHRIGPHQAEIGHHRDRPFAGKTQTLASIAAVEVTDGSDEVEFLDESARGLLENQNNFAGATGDFRSATGSGKTGVRFFVIADDRGVDVCKAIDLRGAEKSDVHAAALQPVAENFRRG